MKSESKSHHQPNGIRLVVQIGILLFFSSLLWALPEFLLRYSENPYSMEKWQHCGLCHSDPRGGGYGVRVTSFGEAFKRADFTVTDQLRAEFPDRFLPVSREEGGPSAGETLKDPNFGIWKTPAPISGIASDSEGRAWVTSPAEKAVYRFDVLSNDFQKMLAPGVCHEIVIGKDDRAYYLSSADRGQAATGISVLEPGGKAGKRFAAPETNTALNWLFLEAGGKVIWSHAGGGVLLRFDLIGEEWTRFEIAGKDNLLRLTRPASNGEGAVWVGDLENAIILRLDPVSGDFISFKIKDHLKAGGTRPALTITEKQGVFLASANTLLHLDPLTGEYQLHTVPCDVAPARVTDLISDTEGRAWLSDAACIAIWKFDPIAGSFTRFPLPTDQISELSPEIGLHMDEWGGLWFAGDGGQKLGMLSTVDY